MYISVSVSDPEVKKQHSQSLCYIHTFKCTLMKSGFNFFFHYIWVDQNLDVSGINVKVTYNQRPIDLSTTMTECQCLI